jgi:hypothetical protein
MRLNLPTIQPGAAPSAPMLDSPEWRADFARGVRAALAAEGTRPLYIVRALRAMRETLGPTDLFEVSAPGESANTKLRKNAAVTLAFTGAPAASSGRWNACPASTPACERNCVLSDACGLARIEKLAGLRAIMDARARRTRAIREHPVAAGIELARAAARARRLANNLGVRRVVARLNVATDLGFETIDAIDDAYQRFGVHAYAYTKRPSAVRAALANGGRVGRTRIVFSWSERTAAAPALAFDYLRAGGTVAVVFAGLGAGRYARPLPDSWNGFRCIDGDATDDRTTDPRGVVVALRGKGPLASPRTARAADPEGFAIHAYA